VAVRAPVWKFMGSFAVLLFAAVTFASAAAESAGKGALEKPRVKMGKAAAQAATPMDLNGKPVDPFVTHDKALVLVFLSPDCPISNRYAPEIQRLSQKFESRGAKFWLVYPDAEVAAGTIREHLREYRYSLPALRDPHHALVKRAGARVTPEAAVFDSKGRLVYRGRIDDRYVDFGQERAAPTKRDLSDAVEASLDGKAVVPPRSRAIGCYIYGAD
jgi:thiol-disulfide isomerase/thioredoxin